MGDGQQDEEEALRSKTDVLKGYRKIHVAAYE